MVEYGQDKIPDFGFPSEEEFQFVTDYFQYYFSDPHTPSSARTPLSNETEARVNEIMQRNFAAQANRDSYWRKSTAEIPEKMLRPGESLTIDDIYAMLHVYYWWDDAQYDPEESLNELFDDLSESRYLEAVAVLHTEFADFCRYRQKKRAPCAQEDPVTCYAKLKKKYEKYGDEYSRREVLSHLLGHYDDEELLDEDSRIGLGERLRQYAVRKLLEVGMDELEAHDAPNVLELERDRRDAPGHRRDAWYRDHILSGGNLESYLRDELPKRLLNNGFLKSAHYEFEDLPPLSEMKLWDESKQIALARRAIESSRDYYASVAITEDWVEHGIIPPYLYRLRPDGVFPGEI